MLIPTLLLVQSTTRAGGQMLTVVEGGLGLMTEILLSSDPPEQPIYDHGVDDEHSHGTDPLVKVGILIWCKLPYIPKFILSKADLTMAVICIVIGIVSRSRDPHGSRTPFLYWNIRSGWNGRKSGLLLVYHIIGPRPIDLD